MKIFLTGASGFVGGAIAAELSKRHEVVAMSRSEKSDPTIAALGATPVRSELGAVDPEQLRGVDVVIHCAAYVDQWGRREDFMRVTVEGTRQLLDAARRAGVQRFIHMGTEAALFAGQPMIEIDESYPYPAKHRYLYPESKAMAEQLVLAANLAGVFETLSLRPRLVWGPGDKTVLPEVLAMIERGAFMWMDQGRHRTSTVHISNLVAATELALTKGDGGKTYFITDDETTTFREFLTSLVQTRGVTPPAKSIPGKIARALSVLVEGVWTILRLRKEPPLTRFAAAIMSAECTIRIDRAKSELGYAPVISVAEGLKDLQANPA
ncbi:MAG: NAD-dependent epimerase/dehydratase family protein [bacterium]|nr:NAD-dependent epimerase/dehydratase family protein [bacterium]